MFAPVSWLTTGTLLRTGFRSFVGTAIASELVLSSLESSHRTRHAPAGKQSSNLKREALLIGSLPNLKQS